MRTLSFANVSFANVSFANVSFDNTSSGRLFSAKISVASLLGLCLLAFEARAQPTEASSWQEWAGVDSWVFLGDSNTFSGGYVAIIDAWLSTQPEGRAPKILNLGVSSETASGLSEVDHPFKRPCVHERIDKLLTMLRPSVVFACYGMNDGIYQPATPETRAAYHDGMRRLAERVHAAGAKFVVLTPPVFEADVVERRGKVGPADTGRFAYFAPYRGYDEVLQEQAQWCLGNEIGADLVVDVRTPLLAVKSAAKKEDDQFAYSKDGVHFGMEAHGLLAESILKALDAPASVLDDFPSSAEVQVGVKRMKLLRDAYLSATGKNRPGMPAGYPVWHAEQMVKRIEYPVTP